MEQENGELPYSAIVHLLERIFDIRDLCKPESLNSSDVDKERS